MTLLFLSTHHQACGIADYAERFEQALVGLGHQVTFFDSLTELKKLSRQKYGEAMARLAATAVNYDIVHIQHEFGFFTEWQAKMLADALKQKKARYRVVVTFHTTPSRKTPAAAKKAGLLARFFGSAPAPEVCKEEAHLSPFAAFDLFLVHSQGGKNKLKKFPCFDPRRIKIIPHPIQSILPEVSESPLVQKIRLHLNLQTGDKVIGTLGFVSKYKGQRSAVNTLKLLPSNYKLVIAGGPHPTGNDWLELDSITDLILESKLQDRVYYTGYLPDADLINIVGLCDSIVLPYHPDYPSSSGIVGAPLRQGKFVITTRTKAFVEHAEDMSGIILTDSAAYADVARTIAQTIEHPPCPQEVILSQADAISYVNVSRRMVEEHYIPLRKN